MYKDIYLASEVRNTRDQNWTVCFTTKDETTEKQEY